MRLAITLAALAAVAALAGCPNNIGQNAKTGTDGQHKGAKELKLDNNEVKSHGVVTYPGGDRADWMFFELPAKESGSLEISLTWTVPRPGLQLAFDVWDEYGKELSKSKASARKKRGLRKKDETIADAKGKIYIRVFAVNRGDAGTYKLVVDYKPTPVPIPIDPTSIAVSDPPRLPEVPAIIEPCTNENFDKKKLECKNFCPDPPDPAWPACKGPDKCPDPKEITNLACWRDPKTRPACPNPWDVTYVQWCKPPPCPTPPDPANPNCKPVSQTARIIVVTIQDNSTIVTVPIGKEKGITSAWHAKLLTNSGAPLSGGAATIVRVDKATTVLKVGLSPDVVNANKTVQFDPP
jgi:hypothetical protein